MEFVEIDAEALDFPENSFDAGLCRFGHEAAQYAALDGKIAIPNEVICVAGRRPEV